MIHLIILQVSVMVCRVLDNRCLMRYRKCSKWGCNIIRGLGNDLPNQQPQTIPYVSCDLEFGEQICVMRLMVRETSFVGVVKQSMHE